MMDYYTLVGQTPVPCDLMTWAMWMESADRRVSETLLYRDKVRVSTVFLGLDHAFFLYDDGPRLFETMIFGGVLNDYQWRYPDWASAEEGHHEAVRLAKDWVYKAGVVCEKLEDEWRSWMHEHVAFNDSPTQGIDLETAEAVWNLGDFLNSLPMMQALSKTFGRYTPPTFWQRIFGFRYDIKQREDDEDT